MKMKLMRLTIITLLLATIYSLTVDASDNYFYPLKTGIGARTLGMGGAFCGLADDVTAAYYNPAGIAQLDGRQIAFMHTNRFNLDIYYDYIGYAQPISYLGSLGVSFARMKTGMIPITSTYDPITNVTLIDGYFEFIDNSFIFTWAKKLHPRVCLGTNLKFIHETFYDHAGRGTDLDIGLLFKPTPNVGIGLNIQDFLVGKMNWDGSDDKLPIVIKTGIGAKFFNNRIRVACDTDFIAHRPVVWHLGAEYALSPTFTVRFGSNDGDLGMGLSVKLKNWIFDYAYEDHDLGISHMISARVDLNGRYNYRDKFKKAPPIYTEKLPKDAIVEIEEVDLTKPKSTAKKQNIKKETSVPTKSTVKPVVLKSPKERLINYYSELAAKYTAAKDYNQAISIYKKLLSIDQNNPEGMLKLAKVYKLKRDIAKANKIYGYILKHFPGTKYAQKAKAALKQGMPFNDSTMLNMNKPSGRVVAALGLFNSNRSVTIHNNKMKTVSSTNQKAFEPQKNLFPEIIKPQVNSATKIVKIRNGTSTNIKQPLDKQPKVSEDGWVVYSGNRTKDTSINFKKSLKKINDDSQASNVVVRNKKIKKSAPMLNPKNSVRNTKVNLTAKKKKKSSDKKENITLTQKLDSEPPAKENIESEEEETSTLQPVKKPVSANTKSNSMTISELYQKGNYHFIRQEYNLAILYYKKLLSLKPKSIDIRFILANNYYLNGDYKEAKKLYQQILNMSDSASPHSRRAKILLRKVSELLKKENKHFASISSTSSKSNIILQN